MLCSSTQWWCKIVWKHTAAWCVLQLKGKRKAVFLLWILGELAVYIHCLDSDTQNSAISSNCHRQGSLRSQKIVFKYDSWRRLSWNSFVCFRNVFSALHMPNTAFTAHRQNIKVPLEDAVGINDSNIIHFGPFGIVFSALWLFQALYHGTQVGVVGSSPRSPVLREMS